MLPAALGPTLTVTAWHNPCTVSRSSILRRPSGPPSGVLTHSNPALFCQRRSASRCRRCASMRYSAPAKPSLRVPAWAGTRSTRVPSCASPVVRWSHCCASSSYASFLVNGHWLWGLLSLRCCLEQMVASVPLVCAQGSYAFGWPSGCQSQEHGRLPMSGLSSSRAWPRALTSPLGSRRRALSSLPGHALSMPLLYWIWSSALTPSHTTGLCGRLSRKATTYGCFGSRSPCTACFARCALVYVTRRRCWPTAASRRAPSWQPLNCGCC